MNEIEKQIKVQAYLDGELGGEELRQVETLCSQDPEAVALLAELRMTRDILAGGESAVQLPESREFYWSKIRREIQTSERAQANREGQL
jgi:anti-sigma factor RsiW